MHTPTRIHILTDTYSSVIHSHTHSRGDTDSEDFSSGCPCPVCSVSAPWAEIFLLPLSSAWAWERGALIRRALFLSPLPSPLTALQWPATGGVAKLPSHWRPLAVTKQNQERETRGEREEWGIKGALGDQNNPRFPKPFSSPVVSMTTDEGPFLSGLSFVQARRSVLPHTPVLASCTLLHIKFSSAYQATIDYLKLHNGKVQPLRPLTFLIRQGFKILSAFEIKWGGVELPPEVG